MKSCRNVIIFIAIVWTAAGCSMFSGPRRPGPPVVQDPFVDGELSMPEPDANAGVIIFPDDSGEGEAIVPAASAGPETPAKTEPPDPKSPLGKKIAALKAAQKAGRESDEAQWYVQVAAPESRPAANAVLYNFMRAGERGEVQEYAIKDQIRYVVLIGPYDSRERAVRELSVIEEYGFSEGQPFVDKFLIK